MAIPFLAVSALSSQHCLLKHATNVVVTFALNVPQASLPMNNFVVTMYNAFQCPKSLYMLMEVAPGGELYEIMAENERCVRVVSVA